MNARPRSREGSWRVGLVVPTLGTRDEWLAAAVSSIECQAAVVQLVIVTTPAAAAHVRAQLPGRSVVAEVRPGIVAAIEAGWAALDGCDVLGWLGDDDELAAESVPDALGRLAASPGAAMVYGDFEYQDAAGRRLVTVTPGRFAPSWLRLGQNFIAQPGCLYLREAIVRQGGLSATMKLAFDADLHLRLSREGAVYCPRTLARIRTHAASLTTAESGASLVELHQAVWGAAGRTSPLVRLRPVWRLAGRVYYRFHRTY